MIYNIFLQWCVCKPFCVYFIRYNRDWRYHKEEKVWITRAPGVEPTVKTKAYERGTYYFFDAQKWMKVAKDFYLEYDKLEEGPALSLQSQHKTNQAKVLVVNQADSGFVMRGDGNRVQHIPVCL